MNRKFNRILAGIVLAVGLFAIFWAILGMVSMNNAPLQELVSLGVALIIGALSVPISYWLFNPSRPENRQ